MKEEEKIRIKREQNFMVVEKLCKILSLLNNLYKLSIFILLHFKDKSKYKKVIT